MRFRRETWSERLRYALSEKHRVALVILYFVLIAGSTIAVKSCYRRQYALPATWEHGVILRFGAMQSPEGDHILVVVRAENGIIATLAADTTALLQCHVGSRIWLVRHGGLLEVGAHACAPRR